MSKSKFYNPIGIAGAAFSGKDTLCKALIENFAKSFNIEAKRYSIAGDFVRQDFKRLIKNNLNLDIDNLDPYEKTLIRPLMVEYGRYMRFKTDGRCFIEKLNKNKTFGKNHIPIVPDIRYTEYKKDELFWIKEEKKGLLIFIQREGIKPANKFEKENNSVLKNEADIFIKVPCFESHIEYISYINPIISNIITTYQSDISLL